MGFGASYRRLLWSAGELVTVSSMAAVRVKPYWWIKIVVLLLALVGVLWLIQSLKQQGPATLDLPTIPAKVQFENPPPTPPEPK